MNNRNVDFTTLPKLNIPRSMFNRNSTHKTTANVGDLIPIFLDEALPGDTIKIKTNGVIRMSTMLKPVMDNSIMDIYYFAVPMRIIWDDWKNFMGESKTKWANTQNLTIPQITAPNGGWQQGTIMDHMGIPIGIPNLSVSVMPPRAYAQIYNDWFRDQNLQDEIMVRKDAISRQGTNASFEPNTGDLGGKVAQINKLGDYFTKALPAPQKGPSVKLPLTGNAPITTPDQNWLETKTRINTHQTDGHAEIGRFVNGVAQPGGANIRKVGIETGQGGGSGGPMVGGQSANDNADIILGVGIEPANLWTNTTGAVADLSTVNAATINDIRLAFAVQKLYEKDAMGGTRYTEIINHHFGVQTSDARQQRAEYLGGKRLPININQVINMTQQGQGNLGDLAAFSQTNFSNEDFTKSFEEHTLIIGLAAVRTVRTYQQGIEKMWSRKSRTDFYWPSLANIGEQAILNKEIYAQGNAQDNEVFGYQEAFAEYRYKPGRISGQFRSAANGSLDIYHYADNYNALPILGETWIKEPKENVDRTLAIKSNNADQIIMDFYIEQTATRPLPTYSIPGNLDRN